MTPRGTVDFQRLGIAPPPTPWLHQIWIQIGLPLKTRTSSGVHGGYLLPKVFVMFTLFALMWSFLSVAYSLLVIRSRESRQAKQEGSSGLRYQLGLMTLRVILVPTIAVLMYIVMGDIIVGSSPKK